MLLIHHVLHLFKTRLWYHKWTVQCTISVEILLTSLNARNRFCIVMTHEISQLFDFHGGSCLPSRIFEIEIFFIAMHFRDTFCIKPNFVEIGCTVAEILWFFTFLV